jgi:hypothetical protein
MKKMIYLLSLLMLICIFAEAKASGSLGVMASDAKFLLRITKKYDSINGMEQNIFELKDICERAAGRKKKKLEEIEKLAVKVEENSALSSADEKYLDRLQGKLGALVNDTLKGMESTGGVSFSPTMMGNLLPESRFDSIDIEKEMEEEELKGK